MVDTIKAMVLAAGVGSRLDPMTRQEPKPLVPIANRPVMEHILNLLRRHGINQVVANLHHLPERVPSYFGNGDWLDMQLDYCAEPKLTGDAGGVRACRSHFQDGTFVVLMGDVITDADLSYVIAQHKQKGAIATIALQKVADVSRFGVAVLNEDGLIAGFQEKPKPEEAISDLASTGIYVLEPEIFDYMPADGEIGFGRQLFPLLVKKGLPVFGLQVFGYWSDIGTVCDYKRVNFEALEGLVELDLPGVRTTFGWMGEGSQVAAGCHINGTLMLGRNSRVEPGVIINGSVIVGDNCYIESGSRLENSIVWSGTAIGARAFITDSILGANSRIPANLDVVSEVLVDNVAPFAHKPVLSMPEFRREEKAS